jgi:hypothetical protein
MSLIDYQDYLLEQGKYIRNVNGSAVDAIPPDVTQSWIGAWQAVTGGEQKCCVCGRRQSFRHKIVGGHVVLGTGGNQGEASAGSEALKGGNRVFIAPICDMCNQNSSYMQLTESAKLMHLWEYLYDGSWGCWEDENGYWIGGNGQYIELIDGWREEWRLELKKYEGRQLEAYDGSYVSSSAPSVKSTFSAVSKPSGPGWGSGGDGLGIYGSEGFYYY